MWSWHVRVVDFPYLVSYLKSAWKAMSYSSDSPNESIVVVDVNILSSPPAATPMALTTEICAGENQRFHMNMNVNINSCSTCTYNNNPNGYGVVIRHAVFLG